MHPNVQMRRTEEETIIRASPKMKRCNHFCIHLHIYAHQVQLKTSFLHLVNSHWILLKSGLTIHVFNNTNLLNNVQEHLDGETLVLNSSRGLQELQMVGLVGNIELWCNPHYFANILSLALIIDQF